jgi:thiaminase (transcriptional activator TenA)
MLPGTGFALTLQADNADLWETMQRHRFVADIIADRLSPDVFRRYLILEQGFVETAILIFGNAMLKAPAFPQRRRLIGVLHSLAEDQLTYFARVFGALGLQPQSAARPIPEAAREFNDGMLAIAERGSYADIIAIMLAAEWMYGSWCLRAAKAAITDAELRHWVALHAETGFLDGVNWLINEINCEAAGLGDTGRQRLSRLFREALRLEIAFHEAPYEDWPIPVLKGESR